MKCLQVLPGEAMESDIIPFHPSFPPPLDDDDDDDGGMGFDEDEFGEFGGFSDAVSYSPLGFSDCTEPPSSPGQPSSAIKAAARKPDCSFNLSAEQYQPTAAAAARISGSSGGQVDAGSSFHLTNGYGGRYLNSGTHAASLPATCSPKEETGFANFTVFTEQAAHPWCCGFTPVGGTEQWGGGMGGTDGLGEKNPGHGIIMDSEPRSHFACKARENGRPKVKHCEKRDVSFIQSSQDHRQSQEAAAAFDCPSHPMEEKEEPGMTADRQREGGHRLNSSQTSELQDHRESEEDGEDREKSVSSVPQTFSEYESAAEDLGSFCEDVSFECLSEDMEPNVSSLASQEDQADRDQTDVEEDELGDYKRSESEGNLRQAEAGKGFNHCDQSATQETTATSNQSDDEFADFKDGGSEDQGDGGHAQKADSEVQCLGSLPPSDSFADFCSAPTQEEGDGSWAEFNEDGKTWTQFREQVSSLQANGEEEEEEEEQQHGSSRRRSSQVSLSCRVQQLLQASFPEVVVPAVEVEEVSSLGALLQPPHLPEGDDDKEERPELCHRAQWAQLGLWWPLRDVHCAVGLRFQWGGSHTNRILLRCLGVDTRNVVFIGMKKQPVAVPAFASSLGMLEPTKDSLPAVCSPGHRAVTEQAPPTPRDIQEPSTQSIQEVLPSRQLDWSSRGLSSSQDGTSPHRAPHFWGRK